MFGYFQSPETLEQKAELYLAKNRNQMISDLKTAMEEALEGYDVNGRKGLGLIYKNTENYKDSFDREFAIYVLALNLYIQKITKKQINYICANGVRNPAGHHHFKRLPTDKEMFISLWPNCVAELQQVLFDKDKSDRPVASAAAAAR